MAPDKPSFVAVKLVPDPDNPRGSRTVAGVTSQGEIVGYLDPESWLTKAMIDDRILVVSRVHYIIGREMRLPVQGIELEVITGGDALDVLAPRLIPNATASGGVENPGLIDRFAGPVMGAAILIAVIAYLAHEML